MGIYKLKEFSRMQQWSSFFSAEGFHSLGLGVDNNFNATNQRVLALFTAAIRSSVFLNSQIISSSLYLDNVLMTLALWKPGYLKCWGYYCHAILWLVSIIYLKYHNANALDKKLSTDWLKHNNYTVCLKDHKRLLSKREN